VGDLKAVIFDVDGTLLDSVDYHAEAWRRAFAHFGHEVSFDDIRTQKGGDQILPVFLPKDVVEKRGKEIDHYRNDLFVREFLPKVWPFPKVRELFERILADRLKIALASSDIFLAACHHAGVRPEESLVVGDSPYDAEAARGQVRESSASCTADSPRTGSGRPGARQFTEIPLICSIATSNLPSHDRRSSGNSTRIDPMNVSQFAD
jgi:phosphoglycolate phosphatase-like HAD superfamily hydrolase